MSKVDLDWLKSKLGDHGPDETYDLDSVVDAINARLIESREEQRAACLKAYEEYIEDSWRSRRGAQEAIEYASLDETPLTNEIVKLRAAVKKLRSVLNVLPPVTDGGHPDVESVLAETAHLVEVK